MHASGKGREDEVHTEHPGIGVVSHCGPVLDLFSLYSRGTGRRRYIQWAAPKVSIFDSAVISKFATTTINALSLSIHVMAWQP
jgi:hypothetical protein